VALAPVVADLLSRWLPVSTVVLEILFGILVAPAVLGIALADDFVRALATIVGLRGMAGLVVGLALAPPPPSARSCRWCATRTGWLT
jgi:hypothetical protein